MATRDLRCLEIAPGVMLDARRAVWIEPSRTLVVADLHLGYAWAHRRRGQLLPVISGEDTLERLAAMDAAYQPNQIVLLGDIVHEAIASPELLDALRTLVEKFGERLRPIAGNHDQKLDRVLRAAKVHLPLLSAYEMSGHRFEHGDLSDEEIARARLAECRGRLFVGHEHPAIFLSDQIASRLRAPCFLVGERLIVVPAFSPWAAGSDVRRGEFLSAYLRVERPMRAIAIVAEKLLPVRL